MPDNLGDRMKGYENVFRFSIPRRMPVIIRVDGKAFHTYTKGLKPFSEKLQEVMNWTAQTLLEHVQNAQFAYVQSDEISIFVHNYQNLNTEPWFGNNVQKIVSVSASIASVAFTQESGYLWNPGDYSADNWLFVKPAYFDSRVWVLPEHEVTNYFIWRQQDWTRNSLQMYARTFFSHKELENKNSSDIHDMLHSIDKNWDELPTHLKRGRVLERKEVLSGRHIWQVNNHIPIFTQDRNYVEKYLVTEE